MQARQKGRIAAEADLRLGISRVIQTRRSTGHQVSDLVAEPMAEPRRGCYRCCRDFWWTICRSFLVTACFIAGAVAVLDMAFYSPLGSMEATYNEPNDNEALVPYASTTAVGADSVSAALTVGETVATALSQTGGPSWPNRFSAAFTVEFSGVSNGVINMTLLADEATILPSDGVWTTRQREQISKHAMQLVRAALTVHGETQRLVLDDRRLQTVLDDGSPEHAGENFHSTDFGPGGQLTLRVNSDGDNSSGFRSSVVSVKGLSITYALAMALLVSSLVCSMQQNPFRPPQTGGPRTGIGQSDAGPPFVGTATLKCPPSWSVERNHVYSLRSWIADLVLWSSSTEVDGQRQGPIAAMQIQGSARELVRELTPQQLRDGNGQDTGLMLLVQLLANRYAPLETENVTKSISEFLSWAPAMEEGCSEAPRFRPCYVRIPQTAIYAMTHAHLQPHAIPQCSLPALAPMGSPPQVLGRAAQSPWALLAPADCSGPAPGWRSCSSTSTPGELVLVPGCGSSTGPSPPSLEERAAPDSPGTTAISARC